MSTTRVFITRYNLPTPGVESLIRAQDGWLRDRTELFERFTVPSVAAQSVPVSWLVYFDPESPEWLRARMPGWTRSAGLHPLFAETVDVERLREDLARHVPRADHLVTMNLDNDDAIARDFAERVDRVSEGGAPRQAVYLSTGLIRSGDAVFLRRDRDNAFCAVREPFDEPLTCWTDWHNRLHLHMPVTRSAGDPGWLQVVHGRNVSNRVRGRRVSPTTYEAQFPPGVLGGAEVARARVWSDALVGFPLRQVRSVARRALRVVVVRVLGKDGVNRLKYVLASRPFRTGS